METEERISLRLGKENLDLMDQFISENPIYRSRSQLCREAVQVFIGAVTKGRDSVTIRIPRHYLELVDYLVAQGYLLSREHSIVRAVEEWFSKDRLKTIEEHRTEIDKTTKKIVSVAIDGKPNNNEVVPP